MRSHKTSSILEQHGLQIFTNHSSRFCLRTDMDQALRLLRLQKVLNTIYLRKMLLSASRYFRVNLTTEEEGDTKSDKWNVQILPDRSLENRFESEIVILRERWTRNWNSQKSRRLPNDNIITPNTYKKSH